MRSVSSILFALAAILLVACLFITSPAAACDPGVAPAPGNPTFSIVQPQAFVNRQPVVMGFAYAPQPVVQPFRQAQAVGYGAAVQPVIQPVVAVKQPRRQVTRQVTTQRFGGILGFRN
ncbi:hypothetical protein [Botrimarina mediterranea]|uniref:hypothetical protein n=1 Tax=Botrimarina mediterranea TaxID=2528022 RepID=UPI00118C2FDE|nr:hypothetical protein K2D_16680 [Planctomycetes bacterium K2D]